jgi:hypothetical protein
LPDFFQLPAVPGKFSLVRNAPPSLNRGENIDKYIPLDVAEFNAMAFTSHVWRKANFVCVELTKMFALASWFHDVHLFLNTLCRFRQTDAQFIECLGSMRSGSMTPHVTQFFRGLERPLPRREDGVLPTLLKVTNMAAKEVNNDRLRELDQPIHCFICLDGSQRSGDDPCSAHTNERHALACKTFWDTCNAENEVQFALGAQVSFHCYWCTFIHVKSPASRSCLYSILIEVIFHPTSDLSMVVAASYASSLI